MLRGGSADSASFCVGEMSLESRACFMEVETSDIRWSDNQTSDGHARDWRFYRAQDSLEPGAR